MRSDGARYIPKCPAALADFIKTVATGNLPPFPLPLLAQLTDASASNILPFSKPGAEDGRSRAAQAADLQSSWDLKDACARVAAAPEGTRNDVLNKQAFLAGMRAGAATFTLVEAEARLSEAAKQAGLPDEEISRTVSAALARGHGAQNGAVAFEKNLDGSIKKSFKNAMLAVTKIGLVVRRNTFSDKIILENGASCSLLPPEHGGTFTDNALSFIRNRIQETFGFETGKEHLLDGIKSLAEDERFDPINEWLDSLVWDGVTRLDTWLPRILGAPSTPLFDAAGRVLVTGMVMRARHPGSKFDLCLVLEGKQGCGKSSLVRALASGAGEEYFSDAPGLIGMENKARAELLAGKWAVELAELSGMAKSEAEGVKAFLSQSSDHYRPAYAAVAVERPRTCVFIATTNSQAYLTDSTGNRRFLPVPCGKIDLAGFRAERDQLFAEAVRIVETSGGPSAQVKRGQALPHDMAIQFGLSSKYWSAAAALADARRVTDPVEDVLPEVVQALEARAKILPNRKKFISSGDLLIHLRLKLNSPVRNNGLATWMGVLGWSPIKTGSGPNQVRGYAK
jgi:Virulence-associated protein E-like domain